jgi:VanZ family protein
VEQFSTSPHLCSAEAPAARFDSPEGRDTGRRIAVITLVLVPLVGAADEWHQSLTPGRDPSFWDWVADALGTVAFVHAYWRHARRSRAVSGKDRNITP